MEGGQAHLLGSPCGWACGHVPTENGHALTLESGSPDLNEKLCPCVPVSAPGSVSGEAALPSRLPSHSWRPAHLPLCPVPAPQTRAWAPWGQNSLTLTLSSASLSMVILASSRWLLRATISWLRARFSSS